MSDQSQPVDDQQLAEYASLIERATPLGVVTAAPGILHALLAQINHLRHQQLPHPEAVAQLEHNRQKGHTA